MTLLRAEGLLRHFAVPGGALHAVDGVELAVARGAAVGVVGESGCGKSTLLRLLARTLDPGAGRILLDGRDIAAVPALRFARDRDRRRIQIVFQDPLDSLNPRWRGFDQVADPLRRLLGLRGAALREAVEAAAGAVGLPLPLLERRPHELSGGQRARVGIARALASGPDLLLLDEPTASLDVSVQAVVIRLLAELRARHGLAMLLVSHDLDVVRLLCEEVAVMYLGLVVERGPVSRVFARPAHPYTGALVAAATGNKATQRPLPGEPASPVDPPADACRFRARCGHATDVCGRAAPKPRALADGGEVACHHPVE